MSLVIVAKVDADSGLGGGDGVGAVSVAFGTRDPDQFEHLILAPVAAFSFACGPVSTTCSDGTFTLRCTVSLVAGAPSTRRAIECDEPAKTRYEFDVGEYDYQFEVSSPAGGFPSTDYDRVFGKIRFE